MAIFVLDWFCILFEIIHAVNDTHYSKKLEKFLRDLSRLLEANIFYGSWLYSALVVVRNYEKGLVLGLTETVCLTFPLLENILVAYKYTACVNALKNLNLDLIAHED